MVRSFSSSRWDNFASAGLPMGAEGPASPQFTLPPPQTSAQPWSLLHDVASRLCFLAEVGR